MAALVHEGRESAPMPHIHHRRSVAADAVPPTTGLSVEEIESELMAFVAQGLLCMGVCAKTGVALWWPTDLGETYFATLDRFS